MRDVTSDLLSVLCIGGIIFGSYKLYKYEAAKAAKAESYRLEQERQLKEHIENTLANVDLEQLLKKASIQNTKLSIEDRVFVKEVLKPYISKIKSAQNISDFDRHYEAFIELVDEFTTGADDEIKSSLLYYKNIIAKKEKEAEERRQLESERMAADLEIRKINKEIELQKTELEYRKAIAEANSNKININLDNHSSNNNKEPDSIAHNLARVVAYSK